MMASNARPWYVLSPPQYHLCLDSIQLNHHQHRFGCLWSVQWRKNCNGNCAHLHRYGTGSASDSWFSQCCNLVWWQIYLLHSMSVQTTQGKKPGGGWVIRLRPIGGCAYEFLEKLTRVCLCNVGVHLTYTDCIDQWLLSEASQRKLNRSWCCSL